MAYSQIPLRCRRLDGKWCNSFSSQYCMYGIKYRTPTHWLSRWSQSDGPIPTWQRGCGFMQPPCEDQVWIFRIVWMFYGKFIGKWGQSKQRFIRLFEPHGWSSYVSECWLEEHHRCGNSCRKAGTLFGTLVVTLVAKREHKWDLFGNNLFQQWSGIKPVSS